MQHRTTACFLILLLLCCGLKCNTDVARVVLPEITNTSETTPLFEMEAILATRGEVHSPIPDAVYDALWGHWTEVGLSTPRDYYTKYIDAGGIAIVGGDLVDDRLFQMAQHAVLVMTSKLPSLRDVLAYNHPGGISGDEIPFRFVLTEHFSKDVQNLPEYTHTNISGTIHWLGACGTYMCRADVAMAPEDWGDTWGPDHRLGLITIIHEMAHAIERAIVLHNLVPQFTERLGVAWEREMEKVRLRTEVDGEPYLPYIDANGEIVRKEDLPAWEDRPFYCMAKSNSHDNPSEMWAWFVEDTWFDHGFEPQTSTYRPIEDTWHPECPNLVSITEEVFPAFPLQWAINAKDYK